MRSTHIFFSFFLILKHFKHSKGMLRISCIHVVYKCCFLTYQDLFLAEGKKEQTPPKKILLVKLERECNVIKKIT